MKVPVCILILALLALLSCESYPEADFYEVNGIVSIHARSLPDQGNWVNRSYYTSVSKIAIEDSLSAAGRLTFPFFIRRPGNYSVWILGSIASHHQEENALNLNVFDQHQFLMDNFRLQMNRNHALGWLNHDVRSGEEITVFFPEPGHYSLVLETGGKGGYVIDKLHLSLNGIREPEGFAFPETHNFRVDPVMAKRDQRVIIPPSWSFGMVAGINGEPGDSFEALNRLKAHQIIPDALAYSKQETDDSFISDIYRGIMLPDVHNREPVAAIDVEAYSTASAESLIDDRFHFAKLWPGAGFTEIQDTFEELIEAGAHEQRRGYVLSGLENLYQPEIKEYPGNWPFIADSGLVQPAEDGENFHGLKETIAMVANPRLSTYEIPFLSLNIGGYYRDISRMEEEEIVRWIQFQTFYTMNYLYSSEGDVLKILSHLPEQSLSHISELLNHRNQLFPYIYSLAHLVRPTAVKPVRGISEHPDQFWLGNAFLVAPVYQKGADKRNVNLPDGLWYNYWDGTLYRGGERIEVEVSLYRVPVFVKAGSIIPYQKNGVRLSAENNERLKVDIYGGDRGTFRLYEDDGVTTRYQLGEFSTTAFRYFEHPDYATFTIGRRVREYRGQPDYREMELNFKFIGEPASITANDEPLERSSWSYDSEQRILSINWSQPYYEKTDFVIFFDNR